MSKLTIRGRLFVRNLCFWLCCIALVTFLFLPIIRLEWSEKSYGVTEEYYANASVMQIFRGSDVQVKIKNAKEWKELGFTQEQMNEALGTVNVKQEIIDGFVDILAKNYSNSGFESDSANSYAQSEIKILFILLSCIIPLCVFLSIIITSLNSLSKRAKENLKKFMEKQGINPQDGIASMGLYNINTKRLISSLLLTIATPSIIITLIVAFIAIPDRISVVMSVIIFVCYLVLVIFVKNLSIVNINSNLFKAILAQRIFTKEQLLAMPFSGDLGSTEVKPYVAKEAQSHEPEKATADQADPAVLLKYKELLDAGAITQEEYDEKKKSILK